MDTPALDLMDEAVTQLRDAGRASEAVSSLSRRVRDMGRGTIPKDQWQALHQEIIAYNRRVEDERSPTSETDRRVSAFLAKALNGDAHGMMQDVVRLLLQARRDTSGETKSG
jgi:hypothetical protein